MSMGRFGDPSLYTRTEPLALGLLLIHAACGVWGGGWRWGLSAPGKVALKVSPCVAALCAVSLAR
jgi:hypothetical protein